MKIHSRFLFLTAVFFFAVCLPPARAAKEASDSPEKAKTFTVPPSVVSYVQKAGKKLEHAAPNIVAGWTEMVSGAINYTHVEGRSRVMESFAGFGRGLVKAVSDTTAGALNFATFIVPVEIPYPGGGLDVESLSGEAPSHPESK